MQCIQESCGNRRAVSGEADVVLNLVIAKLMYSFQMKCRSVIKQVDSYNEMSSDVVVMDVPAQQHTQHWLQLMSRMPLH